jgi:hypothetical protein
VTDEPERASFLADPGEVQDWRLVALLDAAYTTDLGDALPGSAEEIAERSELDADAVRVVLDALTTFGVVERDGDSYRWTGQPPSPGHVAVTRHHARALRRWATELPDRLRGVPPEPSGPQDLGVFLPALAQQARRRADGLVDRCLEAFPGITSVVDLGGGHGEYAMAFARRGLAVTLQDLPAVVRYLEDEGRVPAAGVTLVAGDFHETLAAGPFDLALLAGVTHIFPGQRLQALFAALTDRITRGVAITTMLRNRHPSSPLFATQMLLNGRGGDTHSEQDYRSWLGGAGWTAVDVADLHTGPTVLLTAHR